MNKLILLVSAIFYITLSTSLSAQDGFNDVLQTYTTDGELSRCPGEPFCIRVDLLNGEEENIVVDSISFTMVFGDPEILVIDYINTNLQDSLCVLPGMSENNFTTYENIHSSDLDFEWSGEATICSGPQFEICFEAPKIEDEDNTLFYTAIYALGTLHFEENATYIPNSLEIIELHEPGLFIENKKIPVEQRQVCVPVHGTNFQQVESCGLGVVVNKENVILKVLKEGKRVIVFHLVKFFL
ncbi:MAG: hypothetical protein AAF738_02740 [Bacteroidota bacterium]